MSDIVPIGKFNGVEIHVRPTDDHIDVTAMCLANGREWWRYADTTGAKRFKKTLAATLAIDEARLVSQVTHKGNGERHTFAHRLIGLHCAGWISASFEVWVYARIDELLTKGKVELTPAAPAPHEPLGAYRSRVLLAFQFEASIPVGYWTIFNQTAELLIAAEEIYALAGLPLDKLDLLDGSVGTRWAAYRRDKPWAKPTKTAQHWFPPGDPRPIVNVHAYHEDELGQFHGWMRREYKPVHFGDYLIRKYGPGSVQRALPEFHKRGIPLALTIH